MYNQLDYITNENDEVIVDFIGRYENLVQDVNIVFKNLGLETVSLPHINRSNHTNYREYYTEDTKQLVADRFSRDIECFGYEF